MITIEHLTKAYGGQLAVVTDERRLLLVDVPGADARTAGLSDVDEVAYTPDGQQVVTSHRARRPGPVRSRVDVHDLSTWSLVHRWRALLDGVMGPLLPPKRPLVMSWCLDSWRWALRL